MANPAPSPRPNSAGNKAPPRKIESCTRRILDVAGNANDENPNTLNSCNDSENASRQKPTGAIATVRVQKRYMSHAANPDPTRIATAMALRIGVLSDMEA